MLLDETSKSRNSDAWSLGHLNDSIFGSLPTGYRNTLDFVEAAFGLIRSVMKCTLPSDNARAAARAPCAGPEIAPLDSRGSLHARGQT